MPPLLFIAAAAAVGYFGYRKFIADAEKVSARVRREEKEAANKAHGTLVQDPTTGEYRPAKDDDNHEN